MSFDIQAMQADLVAARVDGWLFYDFRGRDPIAQRILKLPEAMRTRRWFYFVPAKGTPRKLVHKIEAQALDSLPGEIFYYAGLEELEKGLKKILGRAKSVAMQYSPKNAIPYISMVDAGTIEMVRGVGAKIVSSADLVQKYEACWTDEQLRSHEEAGRAIDIIVRGAFQHAAKCVRKGTPLTEYELKQWIQGGFDAAGLHAEEGPDVAVNAHASDPALWPNARNRSPHSQRRSLATRCLGQTKNSRQRVLRHHLGRLPGQESPEKYNQVFRAVKDARDKAVDLICSSAAAGQPLQGWQVDKAARTVIEKAGYGKYFFHRTGHNIGETIHGSGANMDDLETHDVRRLIPRTCTSIEPGIYLPEFGIRSEVNVYIDERSARVTGAVQKEVLALLA